MKIVKSLSTLVLMAGVAFTLGCAPAESTSGTGSDVAPAAGSGVAGGAEAPHSHADGTTHEAEAPAAAPTETPAADPAAPAADPAAPAADPAAPVEAPAQ